MQILDAETGLPDPTPPAQDDEGPDAARIPLRSGVDVRREQAKVYREARAGRIEKADAAKLVWMLGEIRKSIETETIEKRLAELEAGQPNRLPAPR